MSGLDLGAAPVFDPLLAPSRYKGAWGGRGSGKSHFFAELLIGECVRHRGLLSVCIREVQKSLRDSAKRLIEAKLARHGLGEAHGFKVYREQISTPGDGIIIFQGMQDHTAESIKSLEGFGRALVEEAQSLSARSLALLRPTIRAPGSELWFAWNPRHRIDPVDVMLRGPEIPTGAVVVRANWSDNHWFTKELENERQDCLRMSPEQYDHIWEGGYARVTEGAYYARDLSEARAAGRIGHVAADPNLALRAVFDIGGAGARADATAIWIVQYVGRELRWLDYYEAQGQPLATHVNWLRANGYGGAECVLPHDGATCDRVHDASCESALRQAGFPVTIVRNQGKGAAKMRVEAARRLFPNMWFNEEKCAAGLDALGAYHERRDETRGIGLGPAHDWASHGADAFGLGAVAWRIEREKHRIVDRPIIDGGWMG